MKTFYCQTCNNEVEMVSKESHNLYHQKTELQRIIDRLQIIANEMAKSKNPREYVYVPGLAVILQEHILELRKFIGYDFVNKVDG
jgi:hypothetical protein